jgi:ribonuclease P protein subunit RPR2
MTSPIIKKKMFAKKKSEHEEIAKEHIKRYLELAKDRFSKNPSLADRYVKLARDVAMKFRIRMPSAYKRLFCPHCYSFMMPGKTLRVRVHEHRVIYYCLRCKKFWRKPLTTRKQKTKKS